MLTNEFFASQSLSLYFSHLGVLFIVVLLGADPPAHQVIPYSVGQGKVVVTRGGYIAVLDKGKM